MRKIIYIYCIFLLLNCRKTTRNIVREEQLFYTVYGSKQIDSIIINDINGRRSTYFFSYFDSIIHINKFNATHSLIEGFDFVNHKGVINILKHSLFDPFQVKYSTTYYYYGGNELNPRESRTFNFVTPFDSSNAYVINYEYQQNNLTRKILTDMHAPAPYATDYSYSNNEIPWYIQFILPVANEPIISKNICTRKNSYFINYNTRGLKTSYQNLYRMDLEKSTSIDKILIGLREEDDAYEKNRWRIEIQYVK